MKIGVYNQPQGGGIGGAEYLTAALAETLSRSHEVELVHHKDAGLRPDDFAGHYGADLSSVRLRHVAPEGHFVGYSSNPWKCYRAARDWQAALSEPYDLFINVTHALPPFCHAPKGALLVLFPWFDRHATWPWRANGGGARERLRRLYYDWEWRKRFDTYQLKAAISQFTRTWTRRWWDVDCEILPPPADGDFADAAKTDTIISVGRFATGGHTKKQLEMVTAFQRARGGELRGWEYFCVGGLSDSPEDQAYYNTVRDAAADASAHVLANVERARLRGLYEHAKVFWHAAGYGDDVESHPELAEHFGIVTVEAMSAGCVPVVVNKGGQPEIVEHGVSGFLWDTLEELTEYTSLLARDEQLRARMSEAARRRARAFNREAFVNRLLELLRPLLSS